MLQPTREYAVNINEDTWAAGCFGFLQFGQVWNVKQIPTKIHTNFGMRLWLQLLTALHNCMLSEIISALVEPTRTLYPSPLKNNRVTSYDLWQVRQGPGAARRPVPSPWTPPVTPYLRWEASSWLRRIASWWLPSDETVRPDDTCWHAFHWSFTGETFYKPQLNRKLFCFTF